MGEAAQLPHKMINTDDTWLSRTGKQSGSTQQLQSTESKIQRRKREHKAKITNVGLFCYSARLDLLIST